MGNIYDKIYNKNKNPQDTDSVTKVIDPVTNIPNPELHSPVEQMYEKPIGQNALQNIKNKIMKNDQEFKGDPEQDVKLVEVHETVKVFDQHGRLDNLKQSEMDMILMS
eukprot:403343609